MNKVTSKTTIEGAALAATPLTETNCAVEQAAQEAAVKKAAEQAAEKQRRRDRVNAHMLDLSVKKNEPDHTPLFSVGGVPVFTRGNISVIGGKAKSRKTFLISYLCGEMLKSDPDIRIAVVDTEQADFHVGICTQRVHKIMGWDENVSNDRLRVFAIRECDTDESKEIARDAILLYKPDFVFIDGIRELIYGINCEKEATTISRFLLKLSTQKKCHICVVLHQNKGKDDTNLRGHVGTELLNKSESVISVTTKGNVSTVKSEHARNEPFEPFYFKVNDDGLPEICNAPKGQTASGQTAAPKKLSTEHLTTLFNKILSENSAGLKLPELRKKVEDIEDVKEAAAKKRIDKAAEYGIIRLCESSELYSLSSPSDEVDENDDEDTIDD